VIVDQGLELLTDEQARQLLATGDVGRVGITIGALPAIFPVNYRLIDGAIMFRTAPGSKMSAATEGAVVAFEVDDYQLADRSGWSVLAIGPAAVIEDPDLAARAAEAGLEPFADGPRTTIVRIEPIFLSGRRLVHGGRSQQGAEPRPLDRMSIGAGACSGTEVERGEPQQL
jgi:nitroimidazol reductase NimA-like FMN-containing flavoprotein (pyridoxamine 5'-phosphate oxidase superfamily)